MKTLSLLCAAALLALPAGAAAKSSAQHVKKVHAQTVHKRVHAARVKPVPKDPYAAYWNDPSRSGPFSYHGFQ